MRSRLSIVLNVVLLFVFSTCLVPPMATAQAPYLVNYQGRLVDGTNLFTDAVTIVFSLYNHETAGSLVYMETQAVTVVDGLFSTIIGESPDHGNLESAVTNGPLYLELAVAGTTLAPREHIVSSPYALLAGGVGTSAILTSMLADGAVSSNKIDWAKMPPGLQDGDDNTTLAGYAESGSFSPAPQASGSDAVAQGHGAVAAGSYSVVGGGQDNTNRGTWAVISGGKANIIGPSSQEAAISGGVRNRIENSAWHGAIAGGFDNKVRAADSFIGGGKQNLVDVEAKYGTIAGGDTSTIQYDADYSAIGGGQGNLIGSNAQYAVIGGGRGNRITPDASFATVPGGDGNTAGEPFAFAAGRQAKAQHEGAFVWGDSTASDFVSTASNQFLIRAGGGVGINTNDPQSALQVAGTVTADRFEGEMTGARSMTFCADLALDASVTLSNALNDYGYLTGDDVVAATTMPFNVTYSGVDYSNLLIDVNGWVEFGPISGLSTPLNSALPDTNRANAFISAYWDDLTAVDTNRVEFGWQGSPSNRVYVIHYSALTYFGNHPVEFEIQIHEGSDLINVAYLNMDASAIGQGATIGFQMPGAAPAKVYPIVYNGAVMSTNGQSWSIAPVR